MNSIAFQAIDTAHLSNVSGGAAGQPSLWSRRNGPLTPAEKQRLDRLFELRSKALGLLRR